MKFLVGYFVVMTLLVWWGFMATGLSQDDVPADPVTPTPSPTATTPDTATLRSLHNMSDVLTAAPPPAHVHAVQPATTVWDRIADCESNQTWDIDTGNGYRGGLQWRQQTWLAVKPDPAPRNPADATRTQEIKAARNLMDKPWGGWQHWPACTRQLGLR